VVCKSERSRKEEGVLRSLWGSMHWYRSKAEYVCQCAGKRSISRRLVQAGGTQGGRGNVETGQQAGVCEWIVTGRTGAHSMWVRCRAVKWIYRYHTHRYVGIF
jgi:hypothetical protein